jgi:anti-sigma B factor antagonist
MKDDLGLEITPQDNAAVVSFKATSISNYEGIDAAAIRIREYVDEHKPTMVVFDFEQVKFFSSQVLGLLLEIRAKLNELGGEVVISAINPQLHRVFTITNLDKVFRFFPDKQSALEGAAQTQEKAFGDPEAIETG